MKYAERQRGVAHTEHLNPLSGSELPNECKFYRLCLDSSNALLWDVSVLGRRVEIPSFQ